MIIDLQGTICSNHYLCQWWLANVDLTLMMFWGIHLNAMSQEIHKPSIIKSPWKLCIQNLTKISQRQMTNPLWVGDVIWHQRSCPSLVHVMACHLSTPFINLLPDSNADSVSTETSESHFNEIIFENRTFPFKKMHLKMLSEDVSHFIQASVS